MAHNRHSKIGKTRIGIFLAACFLLAAASVSFGADAVSGDVAALTSAMTKDHVQVPKLEAYFLPAKGLEISDKFDGFASEERGIEVVVAVIASPYETIEGSFNEKTLKSRGVELLSKSAFTLNGSPATLMKALHPDGGRNWGKWILLLDGGERTLVANGVFISGDEAAAVDVEAMLKSVVFRPKAAQANSVVGINPE